MYLIGNIEKIIPGGCAYRQPKATSICVNNHLGALRNIFGVFRQYDDIFLCSGWKGGRKGDQQYCNVFNHVQISLGSAVVAVKIWRFANGANFEQGLTLFPKIAGASQSRA